MNVNGKEIELSESTTLGSWLISQGYDLTKTAVLLNGKVVPRARIESEALSNSDRMEIVSFVGGG